ncbi:hypothetical protein ARMGADRAFT_1036396 [Armillaria gallica]|uniref:Uncharacterized protein n=1 Tax=Armillaria gallica TaxID=47427 RepID=A0A2H3CQM7_ARMGA|nr:hypothetical protein ARMGADRAFT_1036396 [Armillaria gallica]
MDPDPSVLCLKWNVQWTHLQKICLRTLSTDHTTYYETTYHRQHSQRELSTTQGYSVIMCYGNLLIDIQNRNSVGGGHIIRLLPVIKEETKFRKKVYYVNFKHCTNGLKPCVVCLVPKLEQYNLDIIYELRTKQQTQEILMNAAAIPTKGAQNKFLSGFGLRNIEDRQTVKLSSFHAGGIYITLKAVSWPFILLTAESTKTCPKVHFKHIIFVIHNILTENNDEHKYHLLNIQAIWDELLRFSALIKEYKQLIWSIDLGTKSWNFPKVHSHQHMVDNILQKGITLNYNMKPNEKMHGPLKDAYQLQTNFKDVAEQILRVDSWCNAALFIHQQFDLHDKQLKSEETSGNNNDKLKDQNTSVSKYSGKMTLHGHHSKGGGVFKNWGSQSFEIRQSMKYANIISKVDRKKMSFKLFKPDEEIQLHGLLKVNYKNMVDWTISTNYL